MAQGGVTPWSGTESTARQAGNGATTQLDAGARATGVSLDKRPPQFDWARNKMGRKAQPVPPIFQPEVPARALYFGAFNPRAARSG
jgi:hypothetical protein